MKIRIHKSLRAYLEATYPYARPRRNRASRSRKVVSAKMLAEAEAAGDAMRYLDERGRVAWRATPQLSERLRDLRADAEADAEAENM
jgi:hypothetical protein